MYVRGIAHREVKEYFVTFTKLSNRLLKIPKFFYRLLKIKMLGNLGDKVIVMIVVIMLSIVSEIQATQKVQY